MAKSRGLSTVDMMSMSASVRRITRIMLKKRRVSLMELKQEIEKLPKEKQISDKDLQEALEEMVKDGWLVQDNTPDGVFYDVQIAKKEGTNTKKAPRKVTKRSSGMVERVWDSLEETSANAKRRENKKKSDDDDKSKPDPLSKLLF